MLASEFRSVIESKGLSAALRQLNERSPYRFSAVFAFDGDVLHNLCFIDKLNPDAGLRADQPIGESYCIYVKRSRQQFSVEDAREDARVAGHPKRGLVYCYYGVPLLGNDGKLLGTACHFDDLPIAVTEEVVDSLDAAAPLIVQAAFPEEETLSRPQRGGQAAGCDPSGEGGRSQNGGVSESSSTGLR